MIASWRLVIGFWPVGWFLTCWWDDLYYSHDMKNKFKRLKETLTEE